MAGRGGAKDDRDRLQARQALSFSMAGLPSPAAVTIDLSRAARSAIGMLTSVPVIQIESGYGTPVTVSTLRIQPQRIEIEILEAPPVLTVTLQVACDGPFLFGWLHVADEVRSIVATSVERLRIVGPGYWAVPVWEPAWPTLEAGSAPAREVQTLTYQNQTVRVPPERVTEAEPAKAGKAGADTRP